MKYKATRLPKLHPPQTRRSRDWLRGVGVGLLVIVAAVIVWRLTGILLVLP